jgi:hypothetical protein
MEEVIGDFLGRRKLRDQHLVGGAKIGVFVFQGSDILFEIDGDLEFVLGFGLCLLAKILVVIGITDQAVVQDEPHHDDRDDADQTKAKTYGERVHQFVRQ